MSKPLMVGGSFAPPLPPETVGGYRALASSASPQVREWVLKFCDMVDHFRLTPDSKRPGVRHPSGKGLVVPLEKVEVERIDEHVPYDEEIEMVKVLFDGIDPVSQKELRDAAYHLLWFACELALDREPITSDKL